jgi:PST family polysaccharide transporter
MLWNLASLAFGQIAMSAIFLVLAHRLEPVTFGHYALAAVLTETFFTLASTSAVSAVLQRQDFSRRTLSTVFWVALAVSAVAVALMLIGADLYAHAVGEPDVASVLEVLSLSTLIMPFAIGPTALMRQRLDFRGIALRGIIAALAGGLAALATAFSPFADWALVVQRFVTAGSAAILMIARTKVVPAAEFDASASRQLLGASSRVFAGQGIASATPRVVDLLVGLFFGAATLGCLRVASKLADIILAALVNPIGQLWIVLIAPVRESADRCRVIFLQLTSLIALAALPGYLGVALIAPDFTRIFLPPEYALVADFLAVICVLGLFVPLTNSRNAILTALKQFDRLVWYSALDLVAATTGLLLLRPFGEIATLMGTGLASIVLIAVALPYLLMQMHTKTLDLVVTLMPSYLAAGTMCVAVLAVQAAFPGLNAWTNMLLKVAVGAVVYVGVLVVFFRRSTIASVHALVSKNLAPASAQ